MWGVLMWRIFPGPNTLYFMRVGKMPSENYAGMHHFFLDKSGNFNYTLFYEKLRRYKR